MRRTFLSLFVIDLACAGGAFFAYQRGLFQSIYAADASMMTSAIAALVVASAVWLGWQAWIIDSPPTIRIWNPEEKKVESVDRWPIYGGPSGDFGLLAERLSVALGLIGTAIGLYLQAKAAPGEVNFTALVTMGCGVVGYVLIAILTFSLESGIKRSAR